MDGHPLPSFHYAGEARHRQKRRSLKPSDVSGWVRLEPNAGENFLPFILDSVAGDGIALGATASGLGTSSWETVIPRFPSCDWDLNGRWSVSRLNAETAPFP